VPLQLLFVIITVELKTFQHCQLQADCAKYSEVWGRKID